MIVRRRRESKMDVAMLHKNNNKSEKIDVTVLTFTSVFTETLQRVLVGLGSGLV